MSGVKFAAAVGVTSLVLVAALAVGGFLFARSALAGPDLMNGLAFGPHGFAGPGFQLPQEVRGLGDLPADQRFSHFTGVQVNLKDKDNKPFTLNVTPGTVSAFGAGTLSVAANDGSSRTFTIDSNTALRGAPGQGNVQTVPASGDSVVVLTLNDESLARLVIDGGKNGFGSGGPWGNAPWGQWHR